jgi:hypothetical protein
MILQAFEDCGHGGDVIFPAGNTYHINSRLNPVVNDVAIDWQGEWLVRSFDQEELNSRLISTFSSQKTWTTGATTHIMLSSKITQLGL